LLHTDGETEETPKLPTPSATRYGSQAQTGKRRPSLNQMAYRDTWPTPSARDWRSGKASPATMARNARPLNEVVASMTDDLWPTPNARDWKGAPGKGTRERGGRQSSLPAALMDSEASGHLSPTFPEWLMGFPIGWSESPRSATPSCPPRPSTSAGASSKPKPR
jgi:hypothetical protein